MNTIQNDLYEIFTDISNFKNVHITYGPEHKNYSQLEWQANLERYFKTYKHLRLDLYYYHFLHWCVQYAIDDLDDENFYYRKNYFCLHIAPLADEGFMSCADEGYFMFCNSIYRFLPYDESNDAEDTAEYLFALKIENDQYMGIFYNVTIEPEKTNQIWKYYCDNFHTWLLKLKENRGNFLVLDENGLPV